MASIPPDYLKNLQNIINSSVVPSPASPASPASASAASPPVNAKLPPAIITPLAKKLKFMLVSTHCHQYTGYSKVSYGILRQLAQCPWLDVTHFAFQKFPQQQFAEGYRPYPSNITVIDACANETPFEQGFGFKQLPDAIRKEKPDVIMIFNDMSVVGKFLGEID